MVSATPRYQEWLIMARWTQYLLKRAFRHNPSLIGHSDRIRRNVVVGLRVRDPRNGFQNVLEGHRVVVSTWRPPSLSRRDNCTMTYQSFLRGGHTWTMGASSSTRNWTIRGRKHARRNETTYYESPGLRGSAGGADIRQIIDKWI